MLHHTVFASLDLKSEADESTKDHIYLLFCIAHHHSYMSQMDSQAHIAMEHHYLLTLTLVKLGIYSHKTLMGGGTSGGQYRNPPQPGWSGVQ